MKKNLIIILLIIIILIIAGGAFFFGKNAAIFDIFFSSKTREQRALNRMVKMYPDKIGDFSLYNWGAEKIMKDSECRDISEVRDFSNAKVDGQVCNRTTVGQYRDGKNNVVFVNIGKLTQGADFVFDKIKQSSDKLGNYNIVRPENHEIGWFPKGYPDVSIIVTQEGIMTKDSNGVESISYRNRASGENPVTQYFISKYAPAENKN